MDWNFCLQVFAADVRVACAPPETLSVVVVVVVVELLDPPPRVSKAEFWSVALPAILGGPWTLGSSSWFDDHMVFRGGGLLLSDEDPPFQPNPILPTRPTPPPVLPRNRVDGGGVKKPSVSDIQRNVIATATTSAFMFGSPNDSFQRQPPSALFRIDSYLVTSSSFAYSSR